jgi:hypothetical protein
VPKHFSFRSGKKKPKQPRHVSVVRRIGTDGKQVEERTEGDPESAGIQDVLKRVSDDLSDGRISKEEAGRRISSIVERLTAEDSEHCVVCDKPKENPESLVCDACGEEVEIERTVEIHIETIRDD